MVLLPEPEVKIWFEHLQTVSDNRKKCAQKASETRRAKKGKDRVDDRGVACGCCGNIYEEETEEIQKWIACDHCHVWYHWTCVGLLTEPDTFRCVYC